MDLFTYKISADYQIVPRVRFWGHEHCALEDRSPARGHVAGRRDHVHLFQVRSCSFHHRRVAGSGASSAFLTLNPRLGGGQIKDVRAERKSPDLRVDSRSPCRQPGCESRAQGEAQTQLHCVELFTFHTQTADSPGRCHRRPPQWMARASFWATAQEIPLKPTYGHKQSHCCLRTRFPRSLSGASRPVTAQALPGPGCPPQSSRLGSGTGEASEALFAETQRACQLPPAFLPQLLPDRTVKRRLTSGGKALRQRISL
ncbi:hypothetical protein PAL_GLEAN10009593 [Pteropus alecto]|uniref:Uncharacterized protein n=1 Tax=Pteropus alecto TaxID=9402 RepID=L5L4I9_PTEAL|nr:hypothetical protein PAL_GLEAN10009593 [Pteropus alecto]